MNKQQVLKYICDIIDDFDDGIITKTSELVEHFIAIHDIIKKDLRDV